MLCFLDTPLVFFTTVTSNLFQARSFLQLCREAIEDHECVANITVNTNVKFSWLAFRFNFQVSIMSRYNLHTAVNATESVSFQVLKILGTTIFNPVYANLLVRDSMSLHVLKDSWQAFLYRISPGRDIFPSSQPCILHSCLCDHVGTT